MDGDSVSLVTIGKGAGITINRLRIYDSVDSDSRGAFRAKTLLPEVSRASNFYKYIDDNGYDKIAKIEHLETLEDRLTDKGEDIPTKAILDNINKQLGNCNEISPQIHQLKTFLNQKL